MLSAVEVFLDLATTIAAVAAGAFFYNRLDGPLRVALVQATVYLIIDLVAWQKPHVNHLLFNLNCLAEMILLLVVAQLYFQSVMSKRMLAVLCIFFLIIFAADILSNGAGVFAYRSAITECIIVTCVYSAVLYRQSRSSRFLRQGMTWAGIGLLVYFATSIPYLSMMNYLQQRDPDLNQKLFQLIVLLGDLRYLLLAAAFCIAAFGNRSAGTNNIHIHDR